MVTYICKQCSKEIRAYAVPKLIIKLKLCTECYQTVNDDKKLDLTLRRLAR